LRRSAAQIPITLFSIHDATGAPCASKKLPKTSIPT
jgi:hypothetical protein